VVGSGYSGVVSIDLTGIAGVVEIDRASRAARIQAGILGPALEDALRPEGLTLRHFPQSFEWSTLGGWIATRSGGHYATQRTHIDDFVESVRMITPAGWMETRRLPGSGAGPDPARLVMGSEGTLGVITEAWMRLQDRPDHRASAAVLYDTFEAGAEAVRALAQSSLGPTNCRLLDAREAAVNGAGDGSHALLVLGFESASNPVDGLLDLALGMCAGNSGVSRAGERQGEVGAWRGAFIRAPYIRDALVRGGILTETFETAVTWDRFPSFHAEVMGATEEALRHVAGSGWVTCRFTHAYPDGVAPYYTVTAPARQGHEIEQWDSIKIAASDVIIAAGGTITHHHAVGRDHRPWYEHERPPLFRDAYLAAKRALDPAAVMNPGCLFSPSDLAAGQR
jgi:alkyldihydroxyacetonephosphate synthase